MKGRYILALAALSILLLYSIHKSDKSLTKDTIKKANQCYVQAITSLENRQEYAGKGLNAINEYKHLIKDDSVNLAWSDTKEINELEKKLKELK